MKHSRDCRGSRNECPRLHRLVSLGVTLSGLLLAVPAMAAEGEGHAEETFNIFNGDLGNVFWTLLIFGLVLVVLRAYAWGPLLGVLQQREDFIRNALESAKSDREAAEARLAEYEQRLKEARAQATEIVEEGRRDAEETKRRIEDHAHAEAEQILSRARREIEIATETATKELYTLSGRLATQIASQILSRELNAKDHERLIEDSIAELGRMESN